MRILLRALVPWVLAVLVLVPAPTPGRTRTGAIPEPPPGMAPYQLHAVPVEGLADRLKQRIGKAGGP